MIDVVQHINHMRAADPGRIIYARALVGSVIVQLLDARLGQLFHIVFAAKVQATGGTSLDAGGLKPGTHAIRAERALVNLLGFLVELRNVERTAGQAVLATDTILLLEIDDAVGILNDRSIGGAAPARNRGAVVHVM